MNLLRSTRETIPDADRAQTREQSNEALLRAIENI